MSITNEEIMSDLTRSKIGSTVAITLIGAESTALYNIILSSLNSARADERDKLLNQKANKHDQEVRADERRKAIEECIKLSDEIEMREPDGGTKQWMAFKAFRNKMRDILQY